MLRLRAMALVLVGTPVMAAILVCIPVLAVRMWGSSQLDGPFWWGAATFGALSLVALGLILRVRARVLATGEAGPSALLARFSPALMLLGVVGGAVLAHFMAESITADHRRFMADECRAVFGEARPVDACLPVMERCDAEARAGDGIRSDRRGRLSVAWPDGLKVPDDPRTRARHLCVWQALAGDG